VLLPASGARRQLEQFFPPEPERTLQFGPGQTQVPAGAMLHTPRFHGSSQRDSPTSRPAEARDAAELENAARASARLSHRARGGDKLTRATASGTARTPCCSAGRGSCDRSGKRRTDREHRPAERTVAIAMDDTDPTSAGHGTLSWFAPSRPSRCAARPVRFQAHG
jgi:hypothetical protein